MLLDRIVIDVHGPLRGVELGPFTANLNSIYGPQGSGKTAIARFICDSLISREYPLGMFSSSSGRIVWADRNGLLHCRREMDGTARGRRSVEFELRGDANHRFDTLESSWIEGAGGGPGTSVEARPMELPDSIVDGVITDVSLSSVARVVTACAQNGLDSHEHRDRLSAAHDAQREPQDGQHLRLNEDLQQIENELASVGELYPDHATLVARKKQLLARLAGPNGGKVADRQHDDGQHDDRQHDDLQHAELRKQLTQLHDRARRLRTRQNELRRWIANINGTRRGLDQSLRSSPAEMSGHRSTTLDDYVQQARGGRHSGDYVAELDRVTSELDRCLGRAAELRRSMRSLQPTGALWQESEDRHGWVDREAMVAELRRIDDCLKQTSRAQSLRSRREELLAKMRGLSRADDGGSPLASAASHWLRRLTAGRLQRVAWQLDRLCDTSGNFIDRDTYRQTGVRIDGRDELERTTTDRALAAMAVRLAAGDLLAATGRHIPLVLETQPDMFCHAGSDAIAAAIADYAHAGRQVVVLTSDPQLSSRLSGLGGRGFQIHAKPITHAHRPLWKPHYQSEQYAGPHPHNYGEVDEPRPVAGPLVDEIPSDAARRPLNPTRSDAEINRDLDVAWREEYRYDDSPTVVGHRSRHHHRPVTEGAKLRDGYFVTDSYSTAGSESGGVSNEQRPPAAVRRSPASPFLLSVDSPIDQAPSIDAVAAARLRGLDVSHIQHLMRHDPNRLADALGLASVEASTIRRWQAECRLVCRVPNLRGFDARILIACGVKTPAQLAAIHPAKLLTKVEAFLATERGQQLLLSGSSHELARITSWIAAANSAPECALNIRERESGASELTPQLQTLRNRRRIIQTMNQRDVADNRRRRTSVDRSDPGDGDSDPKHKRRRSAASKSSAEEPNRNVASSGKRRRRRRRRNSSEVDTEGSRRDLVRYQPELSEPTSKQGEDTSARRNRRDIVVEKQPGLQFNLHRADDVVDAPAIGPRMAERLSAIEIVTVGELLSADPETLAADLDHRRVDSDTVLDWQQQATLVCRVPMLRGHDAQLLVAAEVTTPEELAQCDAEDLFEAVQEIAQSREGRRIIRGGDPPDLAEVTDWIEYAQHKRELKAA